VETNTEQIICIKCGVALKNLSTPNEDGKTVAIIAYLTLIGFIIAVIQHGSNKTKLGAYHLRQVVGFIVTGISLVVLLLLVTLITSIFGMGSGVTFYITFTTIITFAVWIVLLISLILSLINAVNGKEEPAPVFGKLYEKWFSNLFN
jgi:hypothetical protein